MGFSGFHGFVVVYIPSRKVSNKVEFPPLPPDIDLRPLRNTATHGLTLTLDGKELWAASVPTESMYVYDVQNRKVLPAIGVDKLPNWIAFSPDERYGCVTNNGSDDCSIVDRRTRKEIARIAVGKLASAWPHSFCEMESAQRGPVVGCAIEHESPQSEIIVEALS